MKSDSLAEIQKIATHDLVNSVNIHVWRGHTGKQYAEIRIEYWDEEEQWAGRDDFHAAIEGTLEDLIRIKVRDKWL